MKYFIFTIFLISVFISCAPEKPDAQTVVDRAITASGGELYDNSRYSFDFRDMSYAGERNSGLYSYERMFSDSTGAMIHDVLTNEGFTRYINGEEADVIDTMAVKYTNSVNSVHYFALLPYGLNDPAVEKEYLGETTIKGISYDKVKVTFRQEGGGTDYQDVFVYWINKENSFVDYLGYTYETDGGGKRFREAFNPRVVNGLRFQDYNNFQPQEEDNTDITKFDSLFESGSLELLSKIELENIEVSRVKPD